MRTGLRATGEAQTRRLRAPSSVVSIVSFIASTAAVAVMVPILVRALGAAGYGAWALTVGLVGYINVFDFGLSLCVTRFVAQSRHSDERRAREAVTVGAIALAAVGAMLIASTFAVGSAWEHMTHVAGTTFAFRMAGVAAALTLIGKVAQSGLEGSNRVGMSRAIQGMSSILLAAATILAALVAHGQAAILSAVALALVAVTVCTTAAFIFALIREWGTVPLAWPSRTSAASVGRYALAVQASSILGMVVDPLSRVFVGAYFGAAAVSPLDIAIRTRAQFVGAFAAFVRPLLPRAGAAHEDGNAASLAVLEPAWQQAMVVVPAAGIFAAAGAVATFPTLFGSVGKDAGALSAIGILLWLPTLMATIPYSGLIVRGTARDLIVIQSATSLVAFAIAGAAIPFIGASGAVIAYGLGASVGAVLTVSRTRARLRGAFTVPRDVFSRGGVLLVASCGAAAVLFLPLPFTARIATACTVWIASSARPVAKLVRMV